MQMQFYGLDPRAGQGKINWSMECVSSFLLIFLEGYVI
jgi:hypothetical protein